jgi:hypothetical protein
MPQKPGKGDALRKEKGVFAYFCRRMDKSKASGGTKPAGLDFKDLNVKKEGNRWFICCPLYREAKLNFATSLAGRKISTDFLPVYNPGQSGTSDHRLYLDAHIIDIDLHDLISFFFRPHQACLDPLHQLRELNAELVCRLFRGIPGFHQ